MDKTYLFYYNIFIIIKLINMKKTVILLSSILFLFILVGAGCSSTEETNETNEVKQAESAKASVVVEAGEGVEAEVKVAE